jgi:long-chain acyl-CoA synthetase
MYPGFHVKAHPDRPAFIMAQTGETVSYGELERRSNRIAHFLRSRRLGRLDHYAIFMENSPRYVECCAAGERAGHYYTCVNSYLTPEELAYILDNSQSKILFTSTAKRDVALKAMAQCPRIACCVVVDGPGDGGKVLNLDEAVKGFPHTPIAECSIRPGRRVGRRGSCVRCRSSRQSKGCRCSSSSSRCGATGRA